MKPKNIVFRLFNISNDSIKDAATPLLKELQHSLRDGKRYVVSRIMKLKDRGPSDEDVLAYFASADEYVYGMMIRIASAKDVPELPADFTNQESIDVKALLEANEQLGDRKKVCKSFYRFFIMGNYLVTDMPKNVDIARFENYINWILLRSEMPSENQYHFNPAIDPGKVELSRLKSIVVTDAFKPLPEEKTSKIKRWSNTLMNLFVESDDLDLKKLHKENIISAKLTLNFDRPKDMTVEDYVSATSAILKTSGKPENIHFVFNGGTSLSGSNLLYLKSAELDDTSDVAYIHSMKGVIDSYEKESV